MFQISHICNGRWNFDIRLASGCVKARACFFHDKISVSDYHGRFLKSCIDIWCIFRLVMLVVTYVGTHIGGVDDFSRYPMMSGIAFHRRTNFEAAKDQAKDNHRHRNSHWKPYSHLPILTVIRAVNHNMRIIRMARWRRTVPSIKVATTNSESALSP